MITEVIALTDHRLEALGPRDAIENPRRQRCRQLVGIVDPVETAVTVFGEDLGKVEVSQTGIEHRDAALILVRNIDVIQPGLKRLNVLAVEQLALSLENHCGIQREDRQAATQAGGLAGHLLVQRIVCQMHPELGCDLESRMNNGQRHLRIEDDPIALHLVRMHEARKLTDHAHVGLQHIRLVPEHVELRLQEVGAGNRVGRIWLQGLVAQYLQAALDPGHRRIAEHQLPGQLCRRGLQQS